MVGAHNQGHYFEVVKLNVNQDEGTRLFVDCDNATI